ncbi:MAG: hypothetical protein JMDDDDMK_02455 [Acidobacteria bacterium]|nr:hypothetical protein [Acidobacteriota bacterium]
MRVNWQYSYSRCRVIYLLTIFLTFTVASKVTSAAMIVVRQSEGQQAVKLSVDAPRPMAEAVKQLQEKYGWIITYEDPRLVNESDLLDVTDPNYRQANPGGKKALDPKGGRLEISYFVSSATGKPENPRALLQMLLNAYATSANPSRFELRQTGQIFHVIPSQVKDVRGRWVRQASILDIPITFPENERSVLETLETITRALSSATQIKVVIGTIPLNLFARHRTTQSTSNTPAREVLIKTCNPFHDCSFGAFIFKHAC